MFLAMGLFYICLVRLVQNLKKEDDERLQLEEDIREVTNGGIRVTCMDWAYKINLGFLFSSLDLFYFTFFSRVSSLILL